MRLEPIRRRTFGLGLAALLFLGGAASAADIRVISSGGFAAALKELAPQFERASGDKLILGWGPSMGKTKNAVPQRLARHEPIDVLIMVGYALDDLAKQGKVDPDSVVPLARSGIGMVIKAGAPHPDISTVDGLKRALLAAKSIAYSDSASGVYIQNEMFKRLGIEQQVKNKAHGIPAIPVGEVVAHGDAEIGFQQISELKPIKGIDLVGPLPPEVQKYTVFSVGVVKDAEQPEAGRALIKFLSSPAAAPAIRDSGMEPMGSQR